MNCNKCGDPLPRVRVSTVMYGDCGYVTGVCSCINDALANALQRNYMMQNSIPQKECWNHEETCICDACLDDMADQIEMKEMNK